MKNCIPRDKGTTFW